MTEKVVTCTIHSGINDLMEKMTDGKFRHIPVVEGGSLARDRLDRRHRQHRLAEIEAETGPAELHRHGLMAASVGPAWLA